MNANVTPLSFRLDPRSVRRTKMPTVLEECDSDYRIHHATFIIIFSSPAHVGSQRFGNYDRAILLLKIFQNRNPRPADSQTRSVQCVDKLRLRRRCGGNESVRVAPGSQCSWSMTKSP